MHERPEILSHCDTPIGRLTLTAEADVITGLRFDCPPRGTPAVGRHDGPLEEARAQLHEYFAGERRAFELALDLSSGTPFQRAVWDELRSIPYGKTISYRQLASRLGRPTAVRAVGAAVARTPVPVIVPCHRVVGSNGDLTGYLGGLRRKRSLLELELGASATG